MNKTLKFVITRVALAGILASSLANATTINFSTALPAGHLGESVTIGGVTASGWDVSKSNNAIWSDTGVILNNLQQAPDDLGLGVCLASNCPTTGNGDINEIDNNGASTFEVIRLDFGTATFVNSIGLSSLGGGSNNGFAIFGSNTALPTLSSLTAIAQGTNQSEGSVNPIISIDKTYRYFFVTTLNGGICDSTSDFLLESVTTAPEPYTSGMLGLGLLAIGASLRLRNAKRRQ
jgi:MYXO-CTERM domain-containing protein